MLETLPAIERLDVALPAFRRVAWVSEAARTVWAPRLREIVRAQPRIFGHAVEAGGAPCALFEIAAWQIFGLEAFLRDGLGLAMTVLETRGTSDDPDDQTRIVYRIVVGLPDAVAACEDAWRHDRHDVLLEVLGVPACCRRFYAQTRHAWGLADPTLARALNTPGATMADRIVRVQAAPLLNTLWRGLDLQWLSYEPCSMQCPASEAQAAGWVQAGHAHGFGDQMAALEAMLSWPAEWSALHGIAEIKTPILKLSTNTDATAKTYRVQVLSEQYPDEGATGLHFPFRQPRFARITDSTTFKKGLENPMRAVKSGELAQQKPTETAGVLRPRPRTAAVLGETFARLRQRGALEHRAINALFLSNFFNIVQLDDGATGACINYYRFRSREAAQKTTGWLTGKLASDPLLLTYLFEDGEPDLLQLSLRTCLVSALSSRLLMQPDTFVADAEQDAGLFTSVRSAVVAGFGGYMDYLIRLPGIEHVHLSERAYYRRARQIDQRLDAYRAAFPRTTITVSDGSDNRQRMAAADLVTLKGDAFCHGTMDALLDDAWPCKTVIVQGQSAAVYPAVLFERGVTMINTTIKPDDLIEKATRDYQQFKNALEGHLPAVYLRPASTA